MQNVHATPRYDRALAAIADLLGRLRLEFAFAGSVARSAWLGSMIDSGALDVIVLMNPEQKNQVAMMANNRGFRLDRDEVARTEELDLIPMSFVDSDGDVRVHVLVASNALYARMIKNSVEAGTAKVVTAEDLALMCSLGEDDDSQRAAKMLIHLPEFDRAAYNARLVSIGLSEFVVNT